MSGYIIESFYTCNGSPKGCERERFGQCGYHDNKVCQTHGCELTLDGCDQCGAPVCCPRCCDETTKEYQARLRTYSVTVEYNGIVHAHKVETHGVAQAAQEIMRRLSDDVRILSVVDVTAEQLKT